ncbi:MAG: hypothetical protein KDD60_02250, partial [Bdellovibrionales bacterium]|nr:hypothetical protein [Bdellovibrionales bacterium]
GFTLLKLKEVYPSLQRRFPFVVLTCLIVVAIENHLDAYPLEPRDGPPEALKDIANSSAKSQAVLFLPFTDTLQTNGTVKSWRNFATRNVDYMNWAVDYNLLTINGYSGQRTKFMRELPGITSSFPDDRSIAALSLIPNLSHIVYASKFLTDFDKESFEERLKYYARDLSVERIDNEGFYLLNFHGSTRLQGDTTFRVPLRWPDSQLQFELRAPYNSEIENLEVRVQEYDHYKGEPLEQLQLPSSGDWVDFSINVPISKFSAIPFRYSFKPLQSQERIEVRNIRVVPKQSE